MTAFFSLFWILFTKKFFDFPINVIDFPQFNAHNYGENKFQKGVGKEKRFFEKIKYTLLTDI